MLDGGDASTNNHTATAVGARYCSGGHRGRGVKRFTTTAVVAPLLYYCALAVVVLCPFPVVATREHKTPLTLTVSEDTTTEDLRRMGEELVKLYGRPNDDKYGPEVDTQFTQHLGRWDGYADKGTSKKRHNEQSKQTPYTGYTDWGGYVVDAYGLEKCKSDSRNGDEQKQATSTNDSYAPYRYGLRGKSACSCAIL